MKILKTKKKELTLQDVISHLDRSINSFRVEVAKEFSSVRGEMGNLRKSLLQEIEDLAAMTQRGFAEQARELAEFKADMKGFKNDTNKYLFELGADMRDVRGRVTNLEGAVYDKIVPAVESLTLAYAVK